MNKRDLAKAVAVHADVELKTVTSVLDGFTDVVTAVVARGEPVAISGFAKFVKVERPARMGRNPATGEAIRIKASKRARITPVKAFKEAVMSPTGAPKLARGAWPVVAEAVKSAGKSAAAPAAAPAKRAATGTRKVAATRATATRATAKRAPAKRAPVAKKTVAKKTVARKAPAKRAPVAKKTVAKKTVARKAPAKRAPAAKKTTARR